VYPLTKLSIPPEIISVITHYFPSFGVGTACYYRELQAGISQIMYLLYNTLYYEKRNPNPLGLGFRLNYFVMRDPALKSTRTFCKNRSTGFLV
jgi:hypothetical protein